MLRSKNETIKRSFLPKETTTMFRVYRSPDFPRQVRSLEELSLKKNVLFSILEQFNLQHFLNSFEGFLKNVSRNSWGLPSHVA